MISVVMAHRYSPEILQKTLASIQGAVEIVVFDDAAGELRGVCGADSRVVYLTRDRHATWEHKCGYLWDQGVEKARGGILVLQGGEEQHLTKGVLTRLHERLEPGVAVFPRVLSQDRSMLDITFELSSAVVEAPERSLNEVIKENGKRVLHHGHRVLLGVDKTIPYFYCGMISREDYLRVGGWKTYDVDMAGRMISHGMKFRFVDDGVVLHQYHFSHS